MQHYPTTEKFCWRCKYNYLHHLFENGKAYTEIKIMKKYSKSSSAQKSCAIHGLAYFSMAKEPKQCIFQWYIEFAKIAYFSMAEEPKQRIFPWQKSQNNVFFNGQFTGMYECQKNSLEVPQNHDLILTVICFRNSYLH